MQILFFHSSEPAPPRFQCRDCRVQEHLLHRVGCWRTGQDPPPLEALLVFHSTQTLRWRLIIPKTSRTLRASSSSLTRMIVNVSLKLVKNSSVCWTRMNYGTHSCWSSPTSRICRMQWMRLRSLTNLVSMAWSRGHGIFRCVISPHISYCEFSTTFSTSRLRVQLVVMVSTRVLSGWAQISKHVGQPD